MKSLVEQTMNSNKKSLLKQIAKDPRWFLTGLLILSLVLTACSQVGDNGKEDEVKQSVIILATTTSTQDSGLLDVLVPIFEEQSGYFVKVIAVGTGQALKMGGAGDADVLLVHAPAAEKVLIDNGSAIDRELVMHNDFVIVGPAADPAGIRGGRDPYLAFSAISDSGSRFVSRGDDSGTNKKELKIWDESGVDPQNSEYLESGSGMAATLRIASEKEAYTLTDRATYLSQGATLDLDILVEGHATLLNLYHVMQVNPDNWPLVNNEGAQAWSEFLRSDATQEEIGLFGVEEFGQALFYPDAGKTEGDFS
jgi:tungstate transport system substrate-binding protein